MSWIVEFDDAFEPEFDALPQKVQDRAFAVFGLLQHFGPTLGRPRVDTLRGSKHANMANMKELRFSVGTQPWRVAFAFDPARRAVLLAAGNKAGISERVFYRRLIALADDRFDRHLKGR